VASHKGESQDWDALFADLDQGQQQQGTSAAADTTDNKPTTANNNTTSPNGPEADDPMVKNLTSMGYSRADAVAALEKHDYNLERVRAL
jgi:epidermal growth factor receptor substrate 15